MNGWCCDPGNQSRPFADCGCDCCFELNRARVQEENRQMHLGNRERMFEYRVTFGWHQPNGPGPEDPDGNYSTIWAPSMESASRIAKARYNNQYSHIYAPSQWKTWGQLMRCIRELEVLQFYKYSIIYPYPEVGLTYDGIHIGNGDRYRE